MSRDLHAFLHERGIESRVIEGVGFKAGVGEGATGVASDFRAEPQYLIHVVVRVGNRVIDLTMSQFGTEYARPIIYPHATFKARWRKIKPHYWMPREG